MSNAWVTEPGRTSTAELMGELAVYVTEKGAPYPILPALIPVMFGRPVVISRSLASNRYGGVYISIAARYVPRFDGLLPMLITRASGRSSAAEWYLSLIHISEPT